MNRPRRAVSASAASRRRALEALGALAALGTGCAGLDRPSPPLGPPAPPLPPGGSPAWPVNELPPASPREARGAWVATVANIDWPSRPGLPAAQQRAEALALLDRAQALNLNLLVLQVRPAGDAIYPSTLEPWTEFLSGAQGRPPWGPGEAAWDPLAFWLEQAHARAIELHVWFNPYRARHSAARSPAVAPHVSVRQPALVRRYGEQLWMDPGEPAAAEHTLAVVADVLRRYAVDGVHIDDYFYPYPVLANPAAGPGSAELPFPDDAPWARHQAAGGTLSRDDWRRAHVDALVRQLHATVQRTRPGTRFGISPFGPTAGPPASPASASTTSCSPTSSAGSPRAGWTTWCRSCTGPSTAWASSSRCCWRIGSASCSSCRRCRSATCGRACSPARSAAAPTSRRARARGPPPSCWPRCS
jgi:uncharacterized lipoprotein YddW (UPF0748 family)